MDTHASTASPFAGMKVEQCYQCGKCTAGCPMAAEMDVTPNQVFRLVQLGHVDKAAGSGAIWLCCSCFTCTARCPQSVDCVGVIDALRQMAAQRGLAPAGYERIRVFQEAFLDNVRKNGRVDEVALIRDFKLAGFMKDFSVPLLFKDALLAPELMKRGKFHLFGEKVRDRGVVERIFARCAPAKEESV